MKFTQLGKSSLHISEMSLGCMSLPTSIHEAQPIVDAAIDAGIRYFDTADLYDRGVNEEIIGTLLAPYGDEVTVATKVGNRWTPGEDGWAWDASPAYIEQAVKDSLRRLKRDTIDLYQLHGGTTDDNWPAIIDTFESLKKQGLIREYGISSIRPNVFVPFFEQSTAVSNMMQYNLLDRSADEWFDQMQANGGSIVTRGSLAKGLLTNEWQQRVKAYMNYNEDEVRSTVQALEAAYGSVHALAIAFNLRHTAVASTVIGASSRKQLQQSLDAYEQAQLITDFSVAEQYIKHDRYSAHRP